MPSCIFQKYIIPISQMQTFFRISVRLTSAFPDSIMNLTTLKEGCRMEPRAPLDRPSPRRRYHPSEEMPVRDSSGTKSAGQQLERQDPPRSKTPSFNQDQSKFYPSQYSSFQPSESSGQVKGHQKKKLPYYAGIALCTVVLILSGTMLIRYYSQIHRANHASGQLRELYQQQGQQFLYRLWLHHPLPLLRLNQWPKQMSPLPPLQCPLQPQNRCKRRMQVLFWHSGLPSIPATNRCVFRSVLLHSGSRTGISSAG